MPVLNHSIYNWIKRLKAPFPDYGSFQQNIGIFAGIGLFIALFLYLFQPFGIATYYKNPIWICIGFGSITFVVSLIHELIANYLLKIKKDIPSWTLWKWIVYVIILLLLISIANYAFLGYIWNWYSWNAFFFMLKNVFLLGTLPVVFAGMYIQMKAINQNQTQAVALQTSLPNIENDILQTITITSQNKSNSIELEVNAILYSEAMQNYVSICFLEDGGIKKILLRNTIKNIEAQTASTPLFRCHRSYLVNTNLIEHIEGNAQGLRLHLKKLSDFEVPVSRKYIPLLKERLKTSKH